MHARAPLKASTVISIIPEFGISGSEMKAIRILNAKARSMHLSELWQTGQS